MGTPEDTARFRALAARGNLLAIDRADLLYSAKELTRRMDSPTCSDWDHLLSLAGVSKGRPRMVTWYCLQEPQKVAETRSDTDWAG